MKKILLLIVAAIMSLGINAHGIKVRKSLMGMAQNQTPTKFEGKLMSRFDKLNAMSQRKAVKRKAELAENERIVGLYTTDEWNNNGLGLAQYPGTYEIMNFITRNYFSKMVGKSIKSVRFALAQECQINRVFVYLLPEAEDEYITSIVDIDLGGKVCPTGWNTVEVTEPAVLPDNCYGIAIGYEYVQTNQPVTASPLSIVNVPGEIVMLYGNPGNMGEGFYQLTEGALSAQVVVDCGKMPETDVVMEDMQVASSIVEAGSEFTYGFSVYNYGSKDIESYEIEVKMDGQLVQTLTEKDYSITSTPDFCISKFTLPEDIARGSHTLTAELKKVNGAAPTEGLVDDKLSIAFSTYMSSDAVARQKYLVEELTSNSCTYCPLGANVINTMMEKSKNLAVACIHGNQSAKDPFATEESLDLLSYLGSTSFPSATFNRIFSDSEFSLTWGIGYPAQSAGSIADQILEIMKYYSMPSFVSVNIGKTLSEDGSTLGITVKGKGGEYAKELLKDYSLTVYVIEDSLKYRQLDNGVWKNSYWHRHVMRKVATAINGDDINWTSGSEYSNTFEIALDAKWVKEHISVVAFISRRQPLDNIDWTDMMVTNANSIELYATEGGEEEGGETEKIDAGLLVTPTTTTIQLMGEGISPNAKYVAGSNYAGYTPSIWDIEAGKIKNFTQYEEGSLHAVSNNGIAVGSTGGMNGKALICNIDGTTQVLPDNAGENSEGSEAYCITADGSMQAGFYFYFQWLDEEKTNGVYAVYPCTWKDGVCTTLSYPNKEEMGFNVDGAGIRWMSEDGKVLLGYLIDDMSLWPAVVWHQNAEGGYDCDPICKDYFEMGYKQGKPYMLFTPSGLSLNGEWVALTVQEEYDDFDFSKPAPVKKAARYNLKTKKLEVLEMGEISLASSGISNDGTLLAYTETGDMIGRVGYYWPANSEKAICLNEKMEKVENMPAVSTNVPCSFAADGNTIEGFAIDGNANIFSYVINLDNLDETGIESVISESVFTADDRVYNLAGQRIQKMQKGLYIMNGKKYLVK